MSNLQEKVCFHSNFGKKFRIFTKPHLKRWQARPLMRTEKSLVFRYRHTQASVPVERLRLAGKEGTEWVRGSGCTATSDSDLSNQSQLKCYSFVDKIYIQYRNWFILQKLMHPELRLTFFTLSSGVVSQNVKREEIFFEKNSWFDSIKDMDPIMYAQELVD